MSAPTQTLNTTSVLPFRWQLSMRRLWGLVAVSVPIVALVGGLSTVDLAYHLRAGDLMLQTHGIPRTDTFTFTAHGMPWLDQQWAGQILFAVVYRAAGWAGLALAHAALLGAVFGFVFLACRHTGASPRTSAAVTVASFLASITSLSLRPQLLGALLFAMCLWIVAARRVRPGLLWAIPALVAVWANVHGSFFLGPVLMGLAWLDDRARERPQARRTLLIGLVAVAATFLNPFGLRVWTYIVDLSTNPTISAHVSEWRPPAITRVGSIPFFASAATVVILLARRERPTRWSTLLYLGLFLALGFMAARNALWWGLAAAPIAAGLLQERRRKSDVTSSSFANLGVAALLGITFLAFFPWSFVGSPPGAPGARLANAPVGITSQLAGVVRPHERIFVPQNWGSWFELALPENPTFVDSRFEVFPERIWDQYFAVSAGTQGWQRILDRWDVGALVANRSRQRELIPLLKRDPGWRLVYEDGEGLVFLRG